MFRIDVNRIQYAFLFFVALAGSYFMGLITTLRSTPPVPIYAPRSYNFEMGQDVPQLGALRIVRREDVALSENERLRAPAKEERGANPVEFDWGKGPPTSEEMREHFGGNDGSNVGGRNEEDVPEEEGGNVDYAIGGDAQDAAFDDDGKSKNETIGQISVSLQGKAKYDDELRALIASKMPPGLDLTDFSSFEKDLKRCFNGVQYINGCNSENAMKRHRTCAVVGNSGILSKSGCGKDIDDHGFVIRINFPKVKEYKSDVGTKTSLMVVGREVLSAMYRCIKGQTKCSVVDRLDDLDQAYFYHPEPLVDLENQAPRRPFKKISYVKKYVSTRKNAVIFLYSMSGVQERIREMAKSLVERFPDTPSTGAVAYSLALTFCDKVDLYGFFPFKQYQDKAVAQHYHDDPEVGDAGFDEATFEEEWNFMRELASRGALKFHIDQCTSHR